MHDNYRKQNISTLWGIISKRDKDSIPNVQKLACAVVVVPVSTEVVGGVLVLRTG